MSSEDTVVMLFEAGSEALQIFKDELIRDRGRIENEDEPVFDVIINLLDACIAETKRRGAKR